MKRSRFVTCAAVATIVTLSTIAACSSSSATDPTIIPGTLGPGKWGSPTAGLEITDTTGLVRFDFCANGTLTGYAGGIERKQTLLELEQDALF